MKHCIPHTAKKNTLCCEFLKTSILFDVVTIPFFHSTLTKVSLMKVLALFVPFFTVTFALDPSKFLRPADVRPGTYYLLRAYENSPMALADCSGVTCIAPMGDNPNVLQGSKFTFPQGIPGPISLVRDGKVLGTTTSSQADGVPSSVDVSTSGRFDNAIAFSTHGENAISIQVGFDQVPLFLNQLAHINGMSGVTTYGDNSTPFWELYETSQVEDKSSGSGSGDGPTTLPDQSSSINTQATKRAISTSLPIKRRLKY
ncbi:hypothetical protein DL96DRAFT_1675820 [Flagelloscypha sp. PMI_526]|nr:hypothetical protein DL96DRAFT_1675820 [Flagelloscypha sp. PMI_526]